MIALPALEGVGNPVSIPLSFFDSGIELLVDEADRSDAMFFYDEHILETPPRYRVELSKGFLQSLIEKDDRPKQMRLLNTGDTHLVGERTFTGWSGTPSYIPPFADARFADQFGASRSSVVVAPDGRGVAIFGDTYAGKTATLLALLEDGWRLASDSLLVIDRTSSHAHPYRAPLGLRRRTLEKFEARLVGLETRETISEVTGRVVLVRARDLFPNLQPIQKPVKISCGVNLGGAGGVGSRSTIDCLSENQVFPAPAYRDVIKALPNDCLNIDPTIIASDEERASLIADYVRGSAWI